MVFFSFFTLVAGPRRSLSLKSSDTRVFEPQTRALLVTTANVCGVVVLNASTRAGASGRATSVSSGTTLLAPSILPRGRSSSERPVLTPTRPPCVHPHRCTKDLLNLNRSCDPRPTTHQRGTTNQLDVPLRNSCSLSVAFRNACRCVREGDECKFRHDVACAATT